MSMFRIVGTAPFPVMSSGNTAREAVNNLVTLRVKKRYERLVIATIKGNVVHVKVAGENARAYCERYIASLPRDPHSECEAKHAQSALDYVGTNATIKLWQRRLSLVRSLCTNCNPDLKKRHHSWKVVEKSIVNERVTFRKAKAYYDPEKTAFTISEFSRAHRNPMRKVRL